MPLPSCIRVLEGEALKEAERIVDSIAPALYDGQDHRGANLAECTRVVYDGGGLDTVFPDHLRGLAAGAAALGESTAFLSDSITAGQTGRVQYGRFGALEVDLRELAEFVASASWDTEKDSSGEWGVPILNDWPEEAAEIAVPAFVDDWTITSTSGTWCWVDILLMEDCKLTAPEAFLAGYKSARPEVVLDPIAYLHSDGAELITKWITTTTPATNGWRKWLGRGTNRDESYESYTEEAREYFEPMYGAAGSRRIWEIYEATAIADSTYRQWEVTENHFLEVIGAHPQQRADLEAIWDGTYVGG